MKLITCGTERPCMHFRTNLSLLFQLSDVTSAIVAAVGVCVAKKCPLLFHEYVVI